jgi:hypothetical protein
LGTGLYSNGEKKIIKRRCRIAKSPINRKQKIRISSWLGDFLKKKLLADSSNIICNLTRMGDH